MDPTTLLTTILFTPLIAAVIIALFLRRGGYVAAGVSVAAAGIIMVLALSFLLTWDGSVQTPGINWLNLGHFQIELGFLINDYTATMLAVVAFVGFWIHIFSVGYMGDDAHKGRFFGGLSIFMFSMLGIVLAKNLIMIFIFWELVGFSSYMLIAHYCDKGFAAAASKKAFITNRVGDFGLLLGIIWTYWQFGTTDLVQLAEIAEADPSLVVSGIGLLLMCGFLGKSAQFPLHVWLTDAMAGPTPVSALIHAATMVAAGIFFMARIFFLLTPDVLDVILWATAIMAAFGGVCALGQNDIKKTLAYSTLSHLGYMGAALGLGFPNLALLHMAMHACFKATLFLCSGSVIHACHHEQDMFKMGGLFKRMKITGTAFLIAGLSIAAFPLFAGFFSKDTIISGAWVRALETGSSHYYVIYGLLLFAAFTTALYMGRMFCVVFLGEPNSEHADHAKESNLFMTVPLIVLGIIYSLFGGLFLLGEHGVLWAGDKFNAIWPAAAVRSLTSDYHHIHEAAEADHIMLVGLGIFVMLAGFVISYLFYGKGTGEDKLQSKSPGLYHILNKHGWFDDVYDWYVAKVQQRIADIVGFLDLILISGIMVRGSAAIAGALGLLGRASHVGSIHGYVYWFLAGVVIFGAFAFGIF